MVLPPDHPPSPLVRMDPPGVVVFTHAETVQLPLCPKFVIGLLMFNEAPTARLTAFPKRPPGTTLAPLASVPFMPDPPVPVLATSLPLTLSNVKWATGLAGESRSVPALIVVLPA